MTVNRFPFHNTLFKEEEVKVEAATQWMLQGVDLEVEVLPGAVSMMEVTKTITDQ
ncbi:conserved hypothetical protein [Ricinus communis]|uniref:Uncharacterized protein n=1 Tax=Ricinus communis TaxID=3988 RepID=B9RPE4_RICCO|nr:conserved hypothetical protein [Ricinus communis]